MNKPVIILGDPHLGGHLSIGKNIAGQMLNSMVLDQVFLLDFVLETADKEFIQDIIITGDVFEDPKPEPYLIAELFTWISKCKSHNINVHIIMGNHDFVRVGGQYRSSLDVFIEADLDNVHVYKNIDTIYIGDVAYTLIPFRDRKSLGFSSNKDAVDSIKNSIQYELSSIPHTHKKVVVGHVAITGSIPVGNEIDDISVELFFDPSDFNGYDYVWMGHVHAPQVMQKSNPFVAHIGSMTISNFGETEHKKHIVIFDPLIDNCFKKITLPTRSLKKITITIPENIDDLTSYVLEQLEKEKKLNDSIIKLDIVVEGNSGTINKNKLEERLIKLGAFNVSDISESKKKLSIKREEKTIIDNKVNIDSAIDLFVDSFIDENNRSGVRDLAKSIYLELKK